ncbi:hypothetical protein B9Q11_05055 [Candidatus Marsarchaeota G2 archaeon ECH_B_SAG-F08]|jgi:hypothetical protein|uniref:Uncharacterized protein n=4 Tax=Candidatus Marsarchaeota TaxID=1978152 RepID=A0A2R6A6X1_9ARCH|nr:MAG: hypothetical protein B9Q02_11975 [Candidatus Marsarchaeota G1 archaeon BE_D]PSN83164.1 MAG: hypothetical protein B9Q01_05695 [Candidatus Marsarchaeota G1 archaeon OSP_D]PSN88811.1 MAG: hypothetical protein B9Q00_03915 [Candidatus Marsarchaeota G1 archaeon OSP_C]PSN97027.1 MAG: hypothetical protein B9Q11_05055 [Candidatus Marsarchaeota G2 archaeon ECH_B_SAG-F08]
MPKTIESLKEKILRLLIPLKPTTEEKDPDLDVLDPLERYERILKREAERKAKERLKRSET